MPLHARTLSARRLRSFVLAVACATAPAFSMAVADAREPMVSRYDDIEANKAQSMRALGLSSMRSNVAPPYGDLEANKARSRGAR